MRLKNIGLHKGFTLIEVFFVIVILASMTFYGVSFVREKYSNHQIEQTNKEIANILNASRNYYIVNSEWPEDIETLIAEKFLLEGNDCSIWQLEGGGSSQCPNKAIYHIVLPEDSEDSKYISVVLQVPSEEIAQLLVGNIPTSEVTEGEGENLIAASIPSPAITAEDPGRIQDFGVVDINDLDGADIPKPECPPEGGWQPKIVYGWAGVRGHMNPDSLSENGLIYSAKASSEDTDEQFKLKAQTKSYVACWQGVGALCGDLMLSSGPKARSNQASLEGGRLNPWNGIPISAGNKGLSVAQNNYLSQSETCTPGKFKDSYADCTTNSGQLFYATACRRDTDDVSTQQP